MTHKNNGGSAFPFGQISEVTGQPVNGFYSPGMTLRDYFAAKAMQGALANRDVKETAMSRAEWAYEIADAMLKERENENDR